MIKNVVFDLGGVLIDWNPRYVYRELLDSEDEVEYFLTNVCNFAWNHELDLGKDWDTSVTELSTLHPDKAHLIEAYRTRWKDMLGGPIHESVDLLMELKSRQLPLYALSNWHHETFAEAVDEFPFLRLFDGRIISGEVKIGKPDPAIYRLLLDTYALNPGETLFIDDRSENVEAARALGIEAVQFVSPARLEQDLIDYGLIPADEPGEAEDDLAAVGGCCGGECGCDR